MLCQQIQQLDKNGHISWKCNLKKLTQEEMKNLNSLFQVKELIYPKIFPKENPKGFNGKVYQIYNEEIKLILLNLSKKRKKDHGTIHSIRPK